jgi:hypothetical protein
MQDRILDLVPSPHVTEQGLHLDHVPHAASVGSPISYLNEPMTVYALGEVIFTTAI